MPKLKSDEELKQQFRKYDGRNAKQTQLAKRYIKPTTRTAYLNKRRREAAMEAECHPMISL